MRSKRFPLGLITVLAIFAMTTPMGSGSAVAQVAAVLHSFNNNGTDGYGPYYGLTPDSAGNLYGTTSGGGPYNGGTVFTLTPNKGGGWAEAVIYSFGNGTDGASPSGNLTIDKAGNVYGTTFSGNFADLGGITFELTPTTGGKWTETVLHVFGTGTDGSKPSGGVVFDASGNLYGTTILGGTNDCGGAQPGCGTVYELAPGAGGSWTETVLYNFSFNDAAGYEPVGSLTIDSAGNLYGVTEEGGQGTGSVYEVRRVAGGSWKVGVLHSFGNTSSDGYSPNGALIFGSSGNIYGTTSSGGSANGGVVFELTPKTGGWAERILHTFANNGTDGYFPAAGLTSDAAGNLYGTTGSGGNSGSCSFAHCGTVFTLQSTSGGRFAYRILYDFGKTSTDGTVPQDSLTFGKNGDLYGMTLGGGIYNDGTVFELKP